MHQSQPMFGPTSTKVDRAVLEGVTRGDLLASRHLPGDIYASADLHARELETYFLRDWLFIGREEQFANPGDYETRRVLGRPIIIARDKQGRLGAFYNMCRHRGVEVAEGSGNARFFRCPYHGWTYDLSGQLTGAAYMKESADFDPSTCRLPTVHLENWRGNLFINFAEQPRPFTEAIAEFEDDFAILASEKCRLADLTTFRLECNWKFFHENLMDFYHVGVLHSKTFGRFFSWTNDNVSLKPGGGITIRYDAAPSTPEGKALFGKAPWLEAQENKFALTGYLPPNLTLFGRIDCVKLMQAWPLGVDACEVRIYFLFPEPFFADPEFKEKLAVYKAYQAQIYEEDRSMIESMQKAMALPFYNPGRMSIMEKPIHHFLHAYLDRMFGPAPSAG